MEGELVRLYAALHSNASSVQTPCSLLDCCIVQFPAPSGLRSRAAAVGSPLVAAVPPHAASVLPPSAKEFLLVNAEVGEHLVEQPLPDLFFPILNRGFPIAYK